ncbi:MAG TPA: 4-hydroxy-3-methylbut-2-enyl diphosphate reductase [Chthonomonadaceae bacterium]|nr:4-hydroxy-3-methylbut-2-enyl diphosphate reductase [Chthonomonadaceae bacterium]
MTAAPTTQRPPGTRRIVLAEVAGFCFGVRRAVEMTEAARRERSGAVTTLGPIIHNEQVIARMGADGIGTAPTLEQIAEGTVVLSAHGVSPAVRAQAQARGLGIVDVTCPFVTKVHRAACQLHEQGYQVLMVGDAGHTEVRGVQGAVEAIGGTVTVVSTPEAARTLPLGKRVGLVSQTTQNRENFAAIVAEVCKRAVDVRACNTICGATDELQEAAARLARQAEVVLVIGGKNSANTRRLCQLCAEAGTPAYHIASADEIEEAWLEGKTVIGLTAGASTPDWLIEEVARRLNGGLLPDDWKLCHPDE